MEHLKHLLNFLIPVAVVCCIFFGGQMWSDNYNVRYVKSDVEIGIVQDIVKKPAGTYPMYRTIGKAVRRIPVYKPAHTVLKVEIKEKVYELENFNLTSEIKKGDKVKVCYNKPKYYGDIFNLRVCR